MGSYSLTYRAPVSPISVVPIFFTQSPDHLCLWAGCTCSRLGSARHDSSSVWGPLWTCCHRCSLLCPWASSAHFAPWNWVSLYVFTFCVNSRFFIIKTQFQPSQAVLSGPGGVQAAVIWGNRGHLPGQYCPGVYSNFSYVWYSKNFASGSYHRYSRSCLDCFLPFWELVLQKCQVGR